MIEEGIVGVCHSIRSGVCHAIRKCAEANNKCVEYMDNYDENIESSHLEYLQANNVYGWAMSQLFNRHKDFACLAE